MQHTAQNILFVTNNGIVMNNGRSLKLKKGVLGIVDKDAQPTSEGLLVTDTFQTTPKTRTFELRLGSESVPNGTIGRSGSSWKSLPFRLKDIVEISAHAPSLKHSVDEVHIGYDGTNDSSALVLKKGETVAIDLTLKGKSLGVLGYKDSEYNLRFYLTAPDNDTFTMQEIVEEAVSKLQKIELVGGAPLSNIVDIKVINSKNTTLAGTEYITYTLQLPVPGTSNNIAQIASVYPNLDVIFEGEVNGKSTFTALVKAGEEEPTDVTPAPFVAKDAQITLDCGEYESSTEITTGTFAWVKGESCVVKDVEFSILVPDTECGEGRLEELQKAYPELVIVKGQTKNCQTTYTTKVESNLVCDGCSPAVRDLLEAKKPSPFEGAVWEENKGTYDKQALMGIAFKGKEFITARGEEVADTLPMNYDVTKISVSSAPLSNFNNFEQRSSEDSYFKVTRISYGARPSGLGMDYLEQEQETRVYYTLTKKFENNFFANALHGTESLLKPLAQYVMYTVHIRRATLSQSFSQELVEHVRYNILAEVGKHKNIETILNKLASAAGLPTIETYEGK